MNHVSGSKHLSVRSVWGIKLGLMLNTRQEASKSHVKSPEAPLWSTISVLMVTSDFGFEVEITPFGQQPC